MPNVEFQLSMASPVKMSGLRLSCLHFEKARPGLEAPRAGFNGWGEAN